MKKIVFGGLVAVGAFSGSASAESNSQVGSAATTSGVTADSQNKNGQHERRKMEGQVGSVSEQRGRRKNQGGRPSKTGRKLSNVRPEYVDDEFIPFDDNYDGEDYYYYVDDDYYYAESTRKGGKKSKKSGKKGKRDIFADDDL